MQKIFFLFIPLFNFSCALSMEQKEPEWIFLRTIHQPNNANPTDWRIIESQLQLNAKAIDPMEADSFINLIKEAKSKNIPYIFIGLRTNWFYYFVDGSYITTLHNTWQNPITGIPPDAAEFFVVGDDGKITFVKTVKYNSNENEPFLSFDLSEVLSFDPGEGFELNKNLKQPGYGHLLIANLFNTNRQINQLKDKINDLNSEAKTASGKRAIDIVSETKKLDNQIKSLQKESSPEIALQHARQWYEWALKYLPEESEEYKEATRERDKIPYKPEILQQESKEPQNLGKPLLQAIQNLTHSLNHVSTKLV